jgi:hypothetical protein
VTRADGGAANRANARYEARQVSAGLARAMAAAIRLAELLQVDPDATVTGAARLLVDDVSQAARRVAWLRKRLEGAT